MVRRGHREAVSGVPLAFFWLLPYPNYQFHLPILIQLSDFSLALNGPFAIFYFIGRFDDDDVRNYAYQPTMAGINYVFTGSREACDNCRALDDNDVEITGTKVITPMLMDYVKVGQLLDLSPEHVVPFLEDNLKWRIVDVSFPFPFSFSYSLFQFAARCEPCA